MADLLPARASPLGILAATARACPIAELRPLEPEAKFVFRGRGEAVHAAGRAFAVTLPGTACRAASNLDRAALWLGPDEWLLIAPENQQGEIEQAFTALQDMPHALVDVGHRNCGLEISGERAAIVLASGCPLDLDPQSFPVGMCTRTVLGKAEIVLWRIADDIFRIEAWRSFAPYVWRFLDEARAEFR